MSEGKSGLLGSLGDSLGGLGGMSGLGMAGGPMSGIGMLSGLMGGGKDGGKGFNPLEFLMSGLMGMDRSGQGMSMLSPLLSMFMHNNQSSAPSAAVGGTGQ